MNKFRQLLSRVKLQLRGKNHIVGWNMAADEAIAFIRSRQKTVLTFFGYSGMGYEYEKAMLNIAQMILAEHFTQTTLVNIGATSIGIGAIYPLAKSLGFETAGIVTSKTLKDPQDISDAVDYVCFMKDDQFGGNLPNSDELSPTSKAMVECSDELIAIGGNDISLKELLAGQAMGKSIQYFPAEMKHEWAIRRAKKMGLPIPGSFLGTVHEVFGK